jgi:hypothetical protein
MDPRVFVDLMRDVPDVRAVVIEKGGGYVYKA